MKYQAFIDLQLKGNQGCPTERAHGQLPPGPSLRSGVSPLTPRIPSIYPIGILPTCAGSPIYMVQRPVVRRRRIFSAGGARPIPSWRVSVHRIMSSCLPHPAKTRFARPIQTRTDADAVPHVFPYLPPLFPLGPPTFRQRTRTPTYLCLRRNSPRDRAVG